MLLFSNKKAPESEENKICAYCFHAERIKDSDACVCDINGIVKADGCCKKYQFDLFKIEPKPKFDQ